jgi:hypothetical protein
MRKEGYHKHASLASATTISSSEDMLSHVLEASPFFDVDLNQDAQDFNDLNN